MFAKRIFSIVLILVCLTIVSITLTRAAVEFPTAKLHLQENDSAVPNLIPAIPEGWDAPLIPSFTTGTHTIGPLYAGLGAVTYFDWAILNASDTPISTTTVTCLSIGGSPVSSWNSPSYAPNTFVTLEDFAYALPEPGFYTVTLTADCTNAIVESDETDNTWISEFTWNPYINVIIADEHGFDKCDIATTSQMNTWWNDSPYFYSNIYFGGIARACPNSGLNNNWIRNVVERGWNLIPTWVGPQAPCSAFNHRFSPNPGTAREQGRREADAAYQAAVVLGLVPPGSQTILYYDLEAFPNQKICRQAAGQFLSGWTDRLHELGHLSGIYGAGCGSYPTDWPALPAPPDAVWLAHWIFDEYTPSATVWNVACVSNALWDDNERIRQYAGGHNETWGGVTLNIDSNVALGPVVGINPSLLSETETQDFGSMDNLRDFQLLAPDQGWILQNGEFLWKNPGDDLWVNLTPQNTSPLAAFFLNPTTGWTASLSSEGEAASIRIHHTSDQGQTWQHSGNLSFSGLDVPHNLWLHFVDSQTGWLAIQLPSSSNFSLGQLYRTTDGGLTWEELELPIGAPVYFADSQTGWTAGGANGDEFYTTADGGITWVSLAPTSEPGWYSLPTFFNGVGILAATQQGETESRVAFFASTDNGQTWEAVAEIAMPGPSSSAAPYPVSIIDENNWLIGDPATNTLWTTADAGKTFTSATLPTSPTALHYFSPESGWILTFSGACSEQKGGPDFVCQSQQALLETTENGQAWQVLTP